MIINGGKQRIMEETTKISMNSEKQDWKNLYFFVKDDLAQPKDLGCALIHLMQSKLLVGGMNGDVTKWGEDDGTERMRSVRVLEV